MACLPLEICTAVNYHKNFQRFLTLLGETFTHTATKKFGYKKNNQIDITSYFHTFFSLSILSHTLSALGTFSHIFSSFGTLSQLSPYILNFCQTFSLFGTLSDTFSPFSTFSHNF